MSPQMPSPSETQPASETEARAEPGAVYDGAFKRIVVLVEPSAAGVAERYRSQYYRDGEWFITARGPSEATYEVLCALGPSPDPSAVVAILGNQSWTHPRCTVTWNTIPLGVEIITDSGENIVLSPDLVLEGARLLAERAKAVR